MPFNLRLNGGAFDSETMGLARMPGPVLMGAAGEGGEGHAIPRHYPFWINGLGTRNQLPGTLGCSHESSSHTPYSKYPSFLGYVWKTLGFRGKYLLF